MKKKKIRVKDLGWWFIYFLLRWIVGILPMRFSLKLAEVIGTVHYLLDGKIKRRILGNVRLIFGEKLSIGEAKTVVRRNLFNRHKQVVERFFLNRLEKTPLDYIISSIEGIENLDKALSLGRGVILLEPHFGSFDLIWHALGHKGYTVNILRVLAPPNFEDIGEYMAKAARDVKVKCLSSLPVKWIYLRPGTFLRPVFNCLKNNEILYTMADGSRGERFTLVDFLGHLIQLPTGVAHIAAKTGATMLPVFIIREKDNRHRIVIREPIPLNGGDEISIDSAIAHYGRYLEDYVSKYPCHWMTILRIRKKEVVNGRVIIEIPPLYLAESDYFYENAG